MIKKVTLALSLFSAFLYSELSAQAVYFTGVGRALVTNDKLTDVTRDDSKLKASSGYTLFDLGIYAKPNEVLRGGVILRTRNEFGGFFGEGSSLEFRQMQLEGLIAKKVKYEIGDVYLTHTPYTLWNEDDVYGYNKFESNVFALRRDIVNYENFYIGNAWRMQGVNANGKISFQKKYAESIGIRAYGGRTRQTDFTGIPDRYFYGGKLDFTQSKYFRIGANLAGVSDIAGTVKAANINYDNMVYTTDFAFTLDKSEKFRFALVGEAGASTFTLKRSIDSIKNSFQDFFYEVGIKATYKPWNLTMGASYRDVGYNFSSPMAQTRRIAGVMALTNFATLNDSATARMPTLFDAYSQEPQTGKSFYNQSVSTILMQYPIAYDIVEPYGKATPNRRGFTFTADVQTPNELMKAGITVNLLSEGVSEGDSITQEKRTFTKIRGGFTFNLNKLIGFEKLIALNAGIRSEKSSRGGTNVVKLQNSVLDLGVDVEVLKDLHLLGGTKFMTSKGYEVLAWRNELNQITSYSPITLNGEQNIHAAGVRYDYDKVGYFSMQYHNVEFSDKTGTGYKFTMNQLFFVFGLKF
jgi:hypothetical protein